MKFRQVHLDFHTSEAINNIGSEFDEKEFQAALIAGHVDSITLFSNIIPMAKAFGIRVITSMHK